MAFFPLSWFSVKWNPWRQVLAVEQVSVTFDVFLSEERLRRDIFAFTQTRGVHRHPLDPRLASSPVLGRDQAAVMPSRAWRRWQARRSRASASLRSRAAKIACSRPASLSAGVT